VTHLGPPRRFPTCTTIAWSSRRKWQAEPRLQTRYTFRHAMAGRGRLSAPLFLYIFLTATGCKKVFLTPSIELIFFFIFWFGNPNLDMNRVGDDILRGFTGHPLDISHWQLFHVPLHPILSVEYFPTRLHQITTATQYSSGARKDAAANIIHS